MKLDDVDFTDGKALTPDLFPDPHGWDEPVPFPTIEPPVFPTDKLSWWMDQYVKAEAIATQTPQDLAAVLALVIAGAAVAKKYTVLVRGTWTEQTNLFGVVALPPGSRKSAVFRDVSYPLGGYEKIAAEQMKPHIVRAKIAKSTAEKIAAEAEKVVIARPDNQDAMRHYLMLKERAESLQIPASPRFVVDDATPEKLVSMLFQQGGKLALLSPEGGVFERLAGKSASGTDVVEVYLKAHAADDIRLDRIGRGEEFIEKPALSLGLAVQPSMIRALSAKEGFRGRGLLARFLYSMPKCNIGNRDTTAPAVPKETSDLYEECIVDLMRLKAEKPHVLSFSEKARARFAQFEAWVEPRLAEGGELYDFADWGSKLPGAAARIAGILHCCDSVADGKTPESSEIDESVVTRALKIAWYFVGHAKIAFAEMRFGEIHDNAKAILEWLKRDGRSMIGRRDIYRALKDRFKTSGEMDDPLKELRERGYIRDFVPDEKSRGRPPEAYKVNPRIFSKKEDEGVPI